MKTLTMLLTLSIAPASIWATDGQILINQSIIMAAGGFPYTISQPGSYKLTSNLIMNITAAGNSGGQDIAMVIGSSNVTLDLNGFSILVQDPNNLNFSNSHHTVIGILVLNQSAQSLVIENGSITLAPGRSNNGIVSNDVDLFHRSIYRGLLLRGGYGTGYAALALGPGALVQENVMDGTISVQCPSVIVNNVVPQSGVNTTGIGCVASNNTNVP